jgi:RimJ/RimL family protein N-acetyltransferase
VGDPGFHRLTTQRLVIRRFGPTDLAAFVAYRSDPAVARYQSWDAPYPPDRGARMIAGLAGQDPDSPGEWYQFAVALRGSDQLIGDCGVHTLADDPRQAEIGYTLASGAQGHGYATEAVRRLLAYLFGERHLHRVTAGCDDRNVRSAALLDRVGMRREGHLIRSNWAKGEWTNELIFAILHDEWAAGTMGA